MQDGNTMRNNYGCDLDSLTTASRIGMMRSASGDLHYYINGVDQGIACSGLPPGDVGVHKIYSAEARFVLNISRLSLSSSLRCVRCYRPVWSVCPGVHHQLLRPAGQQPLYQQHHWKELPYTLSRYTPGCPLRSAKTKSVKYFLIELFLYSSKCCKI